MVLTWCPRSDNITEGSWADFVLRQDAELVVGCRRQPCHLQPSSRGGGDGHRKPFLPFVIIASWNLFHPAEKEWGRERGREKKKSENKRATGLLWVWFYETWQKSRFHQSFILISCRFCGRDSTDVSLQLYWVLATPIMRIFMFLPVLRLLHIYLIQSKLFDPGQKKPFTYSKYMSFWKLLMSVWH